MKTVETTKTQLYVIKLSNSKENLTAYKIGEGSEARIKSLIDKYNDARGSNSAECIYAKVLPSKKGKRLNDKTVHAHIEHDAKKILVRVDSNIIKGAFDIADGVTEFFTLNNTSADIAVYISDIVSAVSANEYSTNVKLDQTLTYESEKYHQVDGKIYDRIFVTYPEVDRLLYKAEAELVVLLIGQHEPEIVASIAARHTVIIFHDKKDCAHLYKSAKLRNNIIEVFTLQEVFDLTIKFDIIIANPPYGSIGANITESIIDTADFREYINLLPANDYKRNDSKDLYNYQSDMVSIKDGFADAAVTTHLAKIHKTKVNSMTLDEFERSQYVDKQLDKYFKVTSERAHYAIDHAGQLHMIINPDANYTFFLAGRDINHKHLPWNNGKYTENTLTYQWNINKISYDEAKKYSQKHAVEKGEVYFYGNTITFNTAVEKDNFTNFVYDNRLFINKVFTAVQADGRIALGKVFPKVDWSHSWTVEKILADYGYTDNEIKEVMEDLICYKGMED